MSHREEEPHGLRLTWNRGLPLLLMAIIAITGLLYVLLAPPGQGTGRVDGQARIGQAAPDLELPTLEGDQSISLRAMAGSPVAITFWSSACPVCDEGLRLLADAQVRHPDAGIAVLAIVRDGGVRSPEEAITGPGTGPEGGGMVLYALDPDGSAWRTYAAIDLPTSYFIDAEGILRSVSVQPLDPATLDDHLAGIGVPFGSLAESQPNPQAS